MIRHNRKIVLFSLILAGEAIFFLPFVLARVFRPTVLLVFNINNTELGFWFSIYGIVAMVSYFIGGPLADRFSLRNLMTIALGLTSIGGFIMAFIPGNSTMAVIYGFWGMTTILLFWSALIRSTREWGKEKFQGRAFGWLEGGRGAIAAIIATISYFLFAKLMPDQSNEFLQTERTAALKMIIVITSCVTLLSGLLIFIFVPKHSTTNHNDIIIIDDIKKMIVNPRVLRLSVIVLCGYVGYKITDIFSLYAHDVLGLNEVYSAGVGTSALWIRAIVATFAGYYADKSSAGKIISWSFGFGLIGALLITFNLINNLIYLALINLLFIMVGVYGVRALYFALISENQLPLSATGTIVGIISVVGFTPDIFMGPWIGYLLDNNPGLKGHQLVFLLLAIFSFVGLITSLSLLLNRKYNP